MRRREFIALLGGTAVTWPLAARAQQRKVPVLGILYVAGTDARLLDYAVAIFDREMRALGWNEGQNYQVIRLSGIPGEQSMEDAARNLAARDATVIYAIGEPPIRAVQAATATIPIVGVADDMVANGFVASMARPGGNTTGVSILAGQLDVKRLELLHEMVPQARRIGILFDPAHFGMPQIEEAPARLGLEPLLHAAANQKEIEAALAAMRSEHIEAFDVLASPRLYNLRQLAIEAAVPSTFQFPEAVAEGGLMSYGPRLALIYRHSAIQLDKILRGAKPADLPVEQPTVFTLAINLKPRRRLASRSRPRSSPVPTR
jgi:ABC-type uncharacterized transport system substrate-binding protein